MRSCYKPLFSLDFRGIASFIEPLCPLHISGYFVFQRGAVVTNWADSTTLITDKINSLCFLKVTNGIRKTIYTTNAIEPLNTVIRNNHQKNLQYQPDTEHRH